MEFILEIIYLIGEKNGAYVINLDEYSDIGNHWIALYLNDKAPLHILIVLE